MKKMNTRVVVALAVVAIGLVNTPVRTWAGGSGEDLIITTPMDGEAPARVSITEGPHYVHKMRVMPFIHVSNAPQMALWIETLDGEYISTLYVTERVGTQTWRGAPGDDTPAEAIRRKESLPVWAHRRGVQYDDGLFLPTRSEPIADAVTAATPKRSFSIETSTLDNEGFRILFEVNHSTDFNDTYAADVPSDHPAFSGGEWGSGQPSLIYAATVDTTAESESSAVELRLLGHGSPDGSDGAIYPDISGLTTATQIIESARLYL